MGSLPDDVLLEILIFYQISKDYPKEFLYGWFELVRVCRRWRSIILASPVHLNLRLCCPSGKSVRKLLNRWPSYPLVVRSNMISRGSKDKIDDFIASLEHRDRVQSIDIHNLVNFLWEKIITVLQEPIPALKSLHFHYFNGALTLPETFLNESAPSHFVVNLISVLATIPLVFH